METLQHTIVNTGNGKFHIGTIESDGVHVKCGRMDKTLPMYSAVDAKYKITCKKCQAKWDVLKDTKMMIGVDKADNAVNLGVVSMSLEELTEDAKNSLDESQEGGQVLMEEVIRPVEIDPLRESKNDEHKLDEVSKDFFKALDNDEHKLDIKESNRMTTLTNIRLSENEVKMISLQMNCSRTFGGLLEDNYSCQNVEDWSDETGFSKNKVSGLISSLMSKEVITVEDDRTDIEIKDGKQVNVKLCDLYWLTEHFITKILTEDERNTDIDELFDFSKKTSSTDFKVGIVVDTETRKPILKSNGRVMITTSEASEKSMKAMLKESTIIEYEYKDHMTRGNLEKMEKLGFNDMLFVLVDIDSNPLVKETKKYKKNKKTGETKTSIKRGYYIFDNKKSALNGIRQNKSNPMVVCYGPTK